MNKTTFNNIPKIKPTDKKGIVFQGRINHMNIIGIDKTLFNTKRMVRKYKHITTPHQLLTEDIPNDFIAQEIYNPDHIDVMFLSWFDADLKKDFEEIINDIQEYRRKNHTTN